MSLYRSWRPKSFDELVGQDAVVRTLTSAISTGKVAHAYLFSGPRGSGKTSAAKILARCINCVKGPTATPDNTCDNCRAIIDGTALDVLEIDAASNRGIDEIRALRDAVKFAPASMRMKVYIIDEAHMLTKEGANAFLRTLEEPPPHVVFILATTEPERLPVTILSRCQRYAFARIAIPVMIERMREIARAEKIPIDDTALAAIAYRADGGLRDALTMLEQVAAYAGTSAEAIGTSTIDLAFGTTGREYAAALLDSILTADAPGILRIIEDASDSGTDIASLTKSLIAQFRNLLVARIDPELLSRDLAPEDARRGQSLAPRAPMASIVRALRVLSDALLLSRGGNPRIELETALLRLVLSREDPTLEALATRVAALEEMRSARAAPTQKSESRVASNTGEAQSKTKRAVGATSLHKVRAAWQNIRGKVESQRPPLRTPLSRAVVESVEGDVLTLGLPESFFADMLREHTGLIEQAIEDVVGASLHVRLRVDGTVRTAVQPAEPEDPDELFNYASEVIREKS
jgi:DNA polymerase-3 subunit gamma/tau